MLYRAVVQHHMQPFAAGLRVKLAPTLLTGNIASALVGASRALLAARPDLRGAIVEITDSLLDTGRVVRIRRDHRLTSGLPARQLLPLLSHPRPIRVR